MDSKKFLFGGLIGGIANFFLGWLVWGILLMSFMQKHSTQIPGVFRTEENMVWWAMVLGNFAFGFLATYVLMKAGIKTYSGGLITGGILGFLTSLAVDLMMYSQFNIYGRLAMGMDIVASTIVTGIIGAILGWFLGRGGKTAS